MKVYKAIILTLLFVLVVAIIATSLFVINKERVFRYIFGDGRGDWQINIIGNYAITRINGYQICLTHKESEDDPGYSFTLEEDFFVKAFCYNDSYIGIQGIDTQSVSATEEEIESNDNSYYLINVSDDTIYGPYASAEEYEYKCIEHNVTPFGQWYYTKDFDYQIAEEWNQKREQ